MSTLHTALVLAFLAVTAILLVVTVWHRFRIRHVRMTWGTGRFGGLPIWPVLFMGIVTVFLVYSGNTVPVIGMDVFAGYILGGLFWFAAVWLSSSVIVTEYGVIPEVGRSGEAVGWGQVCDWFEVEDRRQTHFVFIYEDFLGERRRVEIPVPSDRGERFRRIVRSKIEGRIETPEPKTTGQKTPQD